MTISEAPARARTIIVRRPSPPAADDAGSGFRATEIFNTVYVDHPLSADLVSDGRLVQGLSELVERGALLGQEEFESAAVSLIEGCAASPELGWHAFYRNSLAELRSGASSFSPVHQRARSLLTGSSVLEVGCCFGFLALQCAQDGYGATAVDICTGALVHLNTAATELGLGVDTLYGDARCLPLPDDSVDTVTLIHLLEHLDASDVQIAISEALRVARHRVVIAVPFEETPSAHFGHRQLLTEDDLRRWAAPWRRYRQQIFTDHGGWLVLER